MIYIQIKGGLGNQMFQFAIGKILAIHHNTKLLLEKEFYTNSETSSFHTPRNFELDIFNVKYETAALKDLEEFRNFSFATKLKKKLGLNFPMSYHEKNFEYNSKLKEKKPPLYLVGYFQSYKYFNGYEDTIYDLFKFPVKKLDPVNSNVLQLIKNTISVGIHIRRGDYVHDNKTKSFHGNLKKEYYLKALSRIKKEHIDLQLIFFSDDSEWVKQEFSDLNIPKYFVDHNLGKDSWKDMFLMSKCNHNIIANSSFSWWGAFLNRNNHKKVFAPKNWFSDPSINTSDITPPNWIKI